MRGEREKCANAGIRKIRISGFAADRTRLRQGYGEARCLRHLAADHVPFSSAPPRLCGKRTWDVRRGTCSANGYYHPYLLYLLSAIHATPLLPTRFRWLSPAKSGLTLIPARDMI